MALLKILALANDQIEQGKVEPIADVIKRLRKRCISRRRPTS